MVLDDELDDEKMTNILDNLVAKMTLEHNSNARIVLPVVIKRAEKLGYKDVQIYKDVYAQYMVDQLAYLFKGSKDC